MYKYTYTVKVVFPNWPKLHWLFHFENLRTLFKNRKKITAHIKWLCSLKLNRNQLLILHSSNEKDERRIMWIYDFVSFKCNIMFLFAHTIYLIFCHCSVLGSFDKGVVDVTNCFCVPHNESEDEVWSCCTCRFKFVVKFYVCRYTLL